MVPNLALVYSSQGANGIAGQGWDLTGLSMFHRCPKTRAEDGFSQPLTMSASAADDGICLDGKRLFDRGAKPDGTGHRYEPELTDFSDITLSADESMFTVVTKGGETRYYGMDDTTRVRLKRFSSDILTPEDFTTGIWLLQKVVDVWGNYYDIHYNNDQKDFTTSGVIVSQIAYTGRLAGSGTADEAAAVPTFESVKFVYESRPDVRTGRLRAATLPRNLRLTRIITDIGVYKLDYAKPATTPTVDDMMLPSRLQSITYCPDEGGCAQPLNFDWDGGGYDWVETPGFKLPDTLSPGTWFMDLDGDGRLDVVSSQAGGYSKVWRNSGTGFVDPPSTSWSLPSEVWSYPNDATPGNTAFADLDGDGLLDGMHINADGFKCPVDTPTCVSDDGPSIWLNRINAAGKWSFMHFPLSSSMSWVTSVRLGTNDSSGSGALVDMDGDGRADIVWMPSGATNSMKVLINTGFNEGAQTTNPWREDSAKYGGITPISDYVLIDANRDGLPDLVGKYDTEAEGKTYLNTGVPLSGHTTCSL